MFFVDFKKQSEKMVFRTSLRPKSQKKEQMGGKEKQFWRRIKIVFDVTFYISCVKCSIPFDFRVLSTNFTEKKETNLHRQINYLIPKWANNFQN